MSEGLFLKIRFRLLLHIRGVKHLRWSVLPKQLPTKAVNIFAKCSILDVWQGSEYASPHFEVSVRLQHLHHFVIISLVIVVCEIIHLHELNGYITVYHKSSVYQDLGQQFFERSFRFPEGNILSKISSLLNLYYSINNRFLPNQVLQAEKS